MISNARGKHSSPGVYMDELDKSYATKSLGITTLGLVGETLKGPAFEPIRISDWNEFKEYFGGTSTEKFKGTGYPKYEASYIAKSFLEESKQLDVCRILGLSGYNAGKKCVIYGTDSKSKYIIAVLRSKAKYNPLGGGDVCAPGTGDTLSFEVTAVTMSAYTSIESTYQNCTNTTSTKEEDYSVAPGKYGRFNLKINNGVEISVSLNPADKDYIINVLGTNPHEGNYPLFVENLYDLAHIQAVDSNLYNTVGVELLAAEDDYKDMYREAVTPWFVSEVKGSGKNADVKKLFRLHTISDGNAANAQIKVTIANISPDDATFDIVIRDYNDTDSSVVILERFNKCSMTPGTSNYIGLKIGTVDGEYANKSKYVTVEVMENEQIEACVPCGFLGYPMGKIGDYKTLPLAYNTTLEEKQKENRQYFGMSDLAGGVDVDVLTYKGKDAYKDIHNADNGYSNGFHLDAILKTTGVTVTVDGEKGFVFETVDAASGMNNKATSMPRITSEKDMANNIYADKRLRKFTCYPYGGFDGWDIYRESRTNTNEYRANKYTEQIGEDKTFNNAFNGEAFGLSGKFINSDYYAYLAGYKQFDNSSKFNINILATPGIDYVNNLDLVNEVLDIVEESRQGDCIYIVTTPDKDAKGNEIDAASAVVNLMDSEISTSYAATYYPWVKYYDSINKKYINLPVTKDVVRNFAHTDNVSHPWFASAGMSRGNVDCVKACHFTKMTEEDTLYEGMINPVKSFGADGVKIWGNKTMYLEDTPLNRINVRRLMIRIKELVMSASKHLIFEQNDNTLDSQFRSIVTPILANAKQNRGISDYRIQTDTSAEASDRHELPAAIFVKPINCLEYISISFTIFPEGTSFDE